MQPLLLASAEDEVSYGKVAPAEEQAEQVLDRFDILMSNAVGIFLRQVVLQRGISFEMKLPDFCFCNPWDF